MSIQEILESAGLPAQRGVYTGRDKPDAYYTFLRLLGTPAVNAGKCIELRFSIRAILRRSLIRQKRY